MTNTTQLSTLIQGFRIYCLAEGRQPTTIRWYLGKLEILNQYFEQQGFPTDAAQITTTHLRAFLVHLRENVRADENNPMKPAKEQGISPKTIQGYARTLKAFFSWLAREGFIPGDPGTLLKIPTAPRVIVDTFSDSQIKQLLSVIDRKNPKGFRDHCLVLVLLDTGARLSEIANLGVNNLELERGVFKVLGKGARERVVPFGAKVQKALWKYMHKFRPEPFHPNVDNVFLRANGKPLSSDQVYRLIKTYGHQAGIKGLRCSPHTCRHTFAKNFLLNGGDLFTLQKILGHSSLAVVRMYVELTSEEVRIQHRLYSPVDAIKL